MGNILYVEDNFQNFRLVMRMLRVDKVEHDIVQAPDGMSGLQLAGEKRPDRRSHPAPVAGWQRPLDQYGLRVLRVQSPQG